MSKIQSKITWHVKNQENLKREKDSQINSEMTEMLKLSDNNFKVVLIKMPKGRKDEHS